MGCKVSTRCPYQRRHRDPRRHVCTRLHVEPRAFEPAGAGGIIAEVDFEHRGHERVSVVVCRVDAPLPVGVGE